MNKLGQKPLFYTLAAVTLCLASCSNHNKQNPNAIYHSSNYSLCEPKLTQNLPSLPGDIAFSIYRTNLSSRYDNYNSMRPYILLESNLRTQELGSDLFEHPGQTTLKFEYWSPDGATAYLWRSYQDPQNAIQEELTGTQNLDERFYLTDLIAVNVQTGSHLNLTGSERVSFYNQSIFYWPAEPNTIGFHAYINKQLRPFISSPNGTNKREVVQTSGPSYTMEASPDGTRYAFQKEYLLYLGNIKAKTEQPISVDCPFQFYPIWAPDSAHFAFVCGPSSDKADLYVSDKDGKNIKKIASRNGYSGSAKIMDTADYHGASDYFDWTNDSKKVVYSALSNKTQAVELFSVDIKTQNIQQLTQSKPGTQTYYPQVSPQADVVAFISNRNGNRDLYTLDLNQKGFVVTQITQVADFCGIYEPYWKPH